jgi:hypothetical protein
MLDGTRAAFAILGGPGCDRGASGSNLARVEQAEREGSTTIRRNA